MLLQTVYAPALKAAEGAVLALISLCSTETRCRARIPPRHGKPAAWGVAGPSRRVMQWILIGILIASRLIRPVIHRSAPTLESDIPFLSDWRTLLQSCERLFYSQLNGGLSGAR